MKRHSTVVLFSTGILLLTIVSSFAGAQSVTFVHITDAHIYDSAAHSTTMGGYSNALDNGSALAWAVLLVNKLVDSGWNIDFVVFTGDFGLEETDCGIVARKRPPQHPLISCQEAVDAAAIAFRGLLVKKVFLVPGNTDVPDEDPTKLAVYSEFVAALKAKIEGLRLSPSDPAFASIIDAITQSDVINGIGIVGLDSSTFKNTETIPGDRAAANFSEQERALKSLRSRLSKGRRPSIIITHIPNLEDPFRDNGIRRAWNLDSKLAKVWQGIITQPDVIAVFAGHFHDSRRIVYMHDYSWASQAPGRIEGEKTWVAPPLAVKLQWKAKPQARGLLLATVTAAGNISGQPLWFGSEETGSAADKADKLAEATAYERAQEYDRAAAAYQQGLSSKDAWVRNQAEEGFQRALKLAKVETWKHTASGQFFRRWWRDIVVAIGVVILLLLARRLGLGRALVAVTRYLIGKPTMMILPPRKGHENAPVDEFRVQLILALRDIQMTMAPFSTSQFLVVGDTKVTAPGTGEELPEVKVGKIELKALIAWLIAVRDLFRRRIRIEIWGSTARVQAVAVQRFVWVEERFWVTPAPGSVADVMEAAQQLAYNMLSQGFLR